MSIHDLRKRFVKDNKFQIPVLQSPYFEYYTLMYDKIYNSIEKYATFVYEVELAGGEEKYLSRSFGLVDKIAEHIKQKESYQRFNSEKLDAFDIPQVNISNKDIFSIENDQKWFMSIDLKKANFNSLKLYDPSIVDEKESYEEFVFQFTNISHIADSKYLRQILFGKLNPKRITKVETFVTYQLLKKVLKFVPEDKIKFFSHDEIVLEFYPNFKLFEHMMSAVNGKAKELGMPARIEVFKLIAQNPHKKLGFVKEKISFNNPDEIHSIEFKGVSEVFFAQAYKKYFNLDIQQEDLMYYHEGQLARFLEPIKES